MRKFFLFFVCLFVCLGAYAQGQVKDLRQTYLWDVTLSMKGHNNAPNIYDKVVEVMVKDIESITNERTEIVVIPFQDTRYCEVWREYATPEGKATMVRNIRNYNNNKITNTNIAAPLQYVIDNVFTADKIDILKLMTDGSDNVNPDALRRILNSWCEMAQQKDVSGYYIVLTDSAKNGELSLLLKDICNFEEVDASKKLDEIANIRQVDSSWKKGIIINVRDEYDKPKRITFKVYSGDGNMPKGFKIYFKTLPNDYVVVDEVAEMQDDNSLEIHPRFLKTQDELVQTLPIENMYSDIVLQYEPTPDMKEGIYASTRIIDKECALMLENKPVKTVKIYVKK